MRLRLSTTWQAKLAWTGSVVLLLIIAAGIANCIDPLPACSHDPCIRLWLHCVWTLINSPALLALWATIASVLGLSEWRKEVKGREDNEAAKAVLRACYRLRNALSQLRA